MVTRKYYRGVVVKQFICTKLIRFWYAMAFICLLTLSACGETDTEIVAQTNHDFNGNFELFSYHATPLKELGQAEAISKKQYGQLLSKIKSPSTMFMCLWRNPSLKKFDGNRPAEIFLSCSFAKTPVKTPKSLIERAKTYNAINRANLKANWKFENGNYRLSRFEVEIRADGKSFRSQNLASDMPQIEVAQDQMKFPKSTSEPFQFNLQSRLPYRRNSGNAQRDPIVLISFTGVAEPIPDWVNY